MAKFEYWFKQDLKKPIKVQTLTSNVFTMDNVGSLIGVEIFSDGVEKTLTGTVNGYCILPDGTTVAVSGTRSNNKAYILLPQSALAIPGFIKIAVKLTNSSEITTLLAVVATVYKSRTDTIITPSQQIITDWSQQIAAEMQAVEDASAAQDAKIDDLKSAINALYVEVPSPSDWSIGNWASSSGSSGTNNKRIKTSLPSIEGLDYKISSDSGVLFFPLFYNGNTYIPRSEYPWISECNIADIAPTGATSFRLTVKTDPEATLTDAIAETAAKIHFFVSKESQKVDKDQGVINAGLSMIVGADGMVTPGKSNSEKEIEGIAEVTDLVTLEKSINLCDPAEIVTGRLQSDGSVDETVTSNSTSGFIPVSAGDVVSIKRNNGGTAAVMYRTRTCAYDAEKNLVAYGSSATSNDYTVPSGAVYVRMSFDAVYVPMISIGYEGTEFVEYVAPHITSDFDFLTVESEKILSNLPMREKKIVNFGDSIFGNFRADSGSQESISSMISKMTGATCHNVAFGGTHAKTMGGTDRAPMDFQSLVTAIISEDWTAQETYATAQGDDYLARVQALEAVDFTAVDVVTISYGTNDWSSQVTPDQYEAALTDGITRLGTAFPNLLFVICTPTIRFKHSDDSGSDDAEDSGGESSGTGAIISSDTIESSSGYKLPQYAEKVEAVGHAMHIPVCENYWTLGINLLNYSTFMGGMAAADLVHPNAKGRRLIANHLADALVRL